MAHKNWCGEKCCYCTTSDESIPCSPDCENLNVDGSRKKKYCIAAGCEAYTTE